MVAARMSVVPRRFPAVRCQEVFAHKVWTPLTTKCCVPVIAYRPIQRMMVSLCSAITPFWYHVLCPSHNCSVFGEESPKNVAMASV